MIVEGVDTKDTKDPKVMVVETKVVEEGVNGVDVVVLIKVCNSDFYLVMYYDLARLLIFSWANTYWQTPSCT